ncbi:tol-pal system protein YbgF [Salinivirga cyanobacteriivorans]|uniref:Tol-pal system protein YbgF n=1 Tax=Salinivirga cyanobacteriivorans TaxID=1307839 RepID=A0A0S2HXK8_9BACT|nr:tetratricopeptide repeat protein [Salinivirga cyanobacteriivorans]ALO14763.1 tol-pal system protein YbgF [Salinivirga cyanobacteriivorans]
MTIKKHLFALSLIAFIALFFAGTLQVSGQSRSDIELAREYLRNKEYGKALSLYEKLYELQPSSTVFFRYYIQSLMGVEDYRKAERIAKRHIRRNPYDLNAHVELGQIYQQQGQDKKAADVYRDIIDAVSDNINRMRQLANVFISRRQFGWAEEVYLEGAKQNRHYKFNYELANVYYYQRNYPKMIDAYLELLAVNDQYLNTVKNRLNHAVYSDTDDTLTELLKDRLLLMSQKHSGRDVFNELLIWAHLHDDEFQQALVQVKALDRRNNENGSRIIDITQKALKNNQYDVVAQGAEYVMGKGKSGSYYILARHLYLKSRFSQVEEGIIYEQAEMLRLAQKYQQAINESRPGARLLPFYTDLTRLYAFYMHQVDSALYWVKKAANLPQLSIMDENKVKILEADVKLVDGQIFDATLIYAAVERDLKNNPIGFEAKLKKALMAFYQCDFQWALGQVDVLKASTSKLIANDAAELSLQISENQTEDSVQTALCRFAKARLAMHQHQDIVAIKILDSLITKYPNHPVLDDVLMNKAELLRDRGNYKEAASLYMRVFEEFAQEPFAAEAGFHAAILFEEQLKKETRAFDIFKTLLKNYPMSIYQPTVRKHIRSLRANIVN